jgi:Xaa-Pro aminopeptidase
VRDYAALTEGTGIELMDFDVAFDLSRAVKSDEEMELVRESMAINEAGFWAVHAAYEPGRTQVELMAVAEDEFVRRGTGRQTMDMVLWGGDGASTPEFRIPEIDRRIDGDDLLLYSLEVAGPGGHWVEFSRPLTKGKLSDDTQRMLEAYEEYFEAARRTMHAGATAHDVHRAVSKPFSDRGYPLGHVTGHSIGMTMIEFPKIGEGVELELKENMVFSMHPHAIADGERACLYMQDTWRIGADGGEPLSSVPLQVFDGTEPNPLA